MDLTTRYMGLDLKSPLVSSASPVNAELDNIRRLEDAGIGAIVLPSLFEEEIDAGTSHRDDPANGQIARSGLNYFPDSSPFHSLPEGYLHFVRRAAEAVEIPIFGSLNGTTGHGWITYAQEMEKAGAKGLELNIYFIPTDLSMTGREVEQRYVDIVTSVRSAVSIPLAIKLSPYFSAFGNMAQEFAGAGANALVLFNRFYQPRIDIETLRLINDLELSGHNETRLPLLWIAVIAGRTNISLAASTGVESADQILQYLLAGADVVMTTSALLRHGVEYVESLLIGVRSWLEDRKIQSLNEMRGMLSQQRAQNATPSERAHYMNILQGFSAWYRWR